MDFTKDFGQWIGISLNKLPESLSDKYLSFLLEYTFQVIDKKKNWSNIVAVALTLIDEGTLSYDWVREVVAKDKGNPVVK